jgi:hypothetical protein
MLTVELTTGSCDRDGRKAVARDVDVNGAVKVSLRDLASSLEEGPQLRGGRVEPALEVALGYRF